VIETPLLADMSQEHIDMLAFIPLGRMGTPEEAACLICFPASEELSFSTGGGCSISPVAAPFIDTDQRRVSNRDPLRGSSYDAGDSRVASRPMRTNDRLPGA
jgi:hypothetical protein